ncbi:hypothetical protein [Vibrio owensii]|uniref:hypothetical protein n=1 Tax=Vibrio owensii TaxID=696485 RepID=UPI004067FED8
MKISTIAALAVIALTGCQSTSSYRDANVLEKESNSPAKQLVSLVDKQNYFNDTRVPETALNETTGFDYVSGVGAGFLFDTAQAGFLYTLAGDNTNLWEKGNVIVLLDESEYVGKSFDEMSKIGLNKFASTVAPSIYKGLTHHGIKANDDCDYTNGKFSKMRQDNFIEYPTNKPEIKDSNCLVGFSTMTISNPINTNTLHKELVKNIKSKTLVAIRYVTTDDVSFDFYTNTNWMMPKNTFLLDKQLKSNKTKMNVRGFIGHDEVYMFLRPQNGKVVKIDTEDYRKNTDWIK